MHYEYDEKTKSVMCDVSNAEECFDMIKTLAAEGCLTINSLDMTKACLDDIVSYVNMGKLFLSQSKILAKDTLESDKDSLRVAGELWQKNH